MFLTEGKTVGRGSKLKQFARSLSATGLCRSAQSADLDFTCCCIFAFSYFKPENCPDFTENKTWLNWKVLLDGTLNNEMQMSIKNYIKAIRQVFKALQIVTLHYVHRGICECPALELDKLDPEKIHLLGKLYVCVLWLIVGF